MTGRIQTALMPHIGSVTWKNFSNTKVGEWERTSISFTVPAGWRYIGFAQQGWNMGGPAGIGIDKATMGSNGPLFSNEGATPTYTVMALLDAATWYIYTKRNGTGSNGYGFYYVAIPAAYYP